MERRHWINPECFALPDFHNDHCDRNIWAWEPLYSPVCPTAEEFEEERSEYLALQAGAC